MNWKTPRVFKNKVELFTKEIKVYIVYMSYVYNVVGLSRFNKGESEELCKVTLCDLSSLMTE